MLIKKIINYFIFLLLLNTYANCSNNKILSDIPLPTNHIISLNYFDGSLNADDLEDLEENGNIFSFLELYNHIGISISNEIDKIFYAYMSLFRATNDEDNIDLKIAVVLPSQDIGGYAKSIPDSVLNYLIFNNKPFKMKVFDYKNQSKYNLSHIMNKIRAEGYSAIILTITDIGINNLKNIPLPSNIDIFIPTININDLDKDILFPSNVLFGGISYKKQIDKLTENIAPKQSVVYSDKSQIGKKLLEYIAKKDVNITSSKKISSKRNYYGKIVKLKQIDENTTIFLNTPIVTSSIILSNLTYYKKETRRILSTQINYSPSLFILTQTQDIKNVYIANSIINRNKKIDDINLLTNNDIIYNWVNYVTTVGINYLINSSGFFTSYYDIPIANNQFIYDIEILSPNQNNFTPSSIKPDPDYNAIRIDDNSSSNIFGF
jgi:hypothetical protein